MATIDFTYDYPYCGYGENGRYQNQWLDSNITLNGSYTHPMVFNNTVPAVSHMVIYVEIENTGSGSVFNRSWDFKVKRSNGSWYTIMSFTMPEDGKYTIDYDIPNYSITQFAVIPSSNPGSSRTWSNWYDVQQLTLTESITLNSLTMGKFLYGVFTNQSGVEKNLNEVYASIDGSLKQATNVLVNIDGKLKEVPGVHSVYLKTTEECMNVYAFTVPESGKYKICRKDISGDHEIRLYSSDFTLVVMPSLLYSQGLVPESMKGGMLMNKVSKQVATYGKETIKNSFNGYHIFDNFHHKSRITASGKDGYSLK